MSDSHLDGKNTPIRVSLVTTFDNQIGETFDVCFSPDGNTILSSDGKAVYVWKLADRGEWEWSTRIDAFAAAPLFAPDGKMFVYRDKAYTLHLATLEGQELIALSYPHQTNVGCAFSPDQRWLVSGDTRGHVLTWDLSTYQSHSTPMHFTFHAPWEGIQMTPSFLQGLQERISSADHFRFTPDGKKLVFVGASDEGYVHICHFDPLNQQFSLQKTLALIGISDQKITPNGRMIAIICQDDVYIYDMESFQQVARFAGTPNTSYDRLAFSPDGQFLASSTLDGNVNIWSLQTFELVTSIAAHPGLFTDARAAIGGLDWSRTGYIVTGGASVFKGDVNKSDYTIKLWKVEM